MGCPDLETRLHSGIVVERRYSENEVVLAEALRHEVSATARTKEALLALGGFIAPKQFFALDPTKMLVPHGRSSIESSSMRFAACMARAMLDFGVELRNLVLD
jgi:hypothetical protein